MRYLFLRALLAPLLLIGLQAHAATWKLDPGETVVTFEYSYEGTHYKGEFKNIEATFEIDPLNLTSCDFSVTIPIADIVIDSDEALDYLLDIELFDVDQFPTASFKASKCSLTSATSFESEGMLTIRDQTHPVAFPFELVVEIYDGQPRFHMTSEVTIQRMNFGVGQGYWADTGSIPNDVVIKIDVYARQYSPGLFD